MVLFLVLCQYLTQLWQVKGPKLTSRGHVMIKIGHVAFVSMRLDERDSVTPFPRLNPRLTGGGAFDAPPSQIFAIAQKRTALST